MMKFDVVLKQFKLKTLMPLLSEILVIMGNSCSFTNCMKKTNKNNNNKSNNVGMHSDMYEAIWFELCLIIDAVEFYSLII